MSSDEKGEHSHNVLEEESGGKAFAKKEATFGEKIAPLAKKITEYILDNQDDTAQEEHWRTTTKRDTAKGFRVQRAALDISVRKVLARQREALDIQREATQKVENDMQRRFDDVSYEAEPSCGKSRPTNPSIGLLSSGCEPISQSRGGLGETYGN